MKNTLRDFAFNNENRGLTKKEYEYATLKYNDCNDKVYIHVIKHGNKIKDIHWDGEGCSISIASASFLSHNLKNMEIKRGLEFLESFEKNLEDDKYHEIFKIFEILKDHKSRKKCVYPSINALKEQLEKFNFITS